VKDQYFGDVNDYRKYGLLRAILTCATVRLGVCWMLTAPDSRTDGRHLAYLDNPRKFRLFDRELFDWLQQTMHQYPDRRTARIEATGLLAGAVYFAEFLADGHAHRNAWFASCRRHLAGCDLVFFDPDNGLERTVAVGRRHSHKFLYFAEVRETFSAGASVLVYQHFPREARAAYIERLAERLRAETGASAIFSFSTPYMLFLLAAHDRHTASFRDAVRKLPLRRPEKEIAAREIHPALALRPADGPRLITDHE
jgi:hypothetical protein